MTTLSANDKGNIAEIEIAAAAVRLGVSVFRPMTEHTRADLVLEIDGRLFRVQCKWGRLSDDGAALVVHVGSCRRSSAGYIRTTYAESEVDLFGIYSGELDQSYLLLVSMLAGRHAIQLRVAPARNGQRACTNLANQFAFEGAVAQLGERRSGTPKVTGSSPVSSTPPPAGGPVQVGANPFRDGFGYWMERAAAGEELLITRHGRPLVRVIAALASGP